MLCQRTAFPICVGREGGGLSTDSRNEIKNNEVLGSISGNIAHRPTGLASDALHIDGDCIASGAHDDDVHRFFVSERERGLGPQAIKHRKRVKLCSKISVVASHIGQIAFSAERRTKREETSPFFEIALVLVSFDHVASHIELGWQTPRNRTIMKRG
jgi:hypothetical protein